MGSTNRWEITSQRRKLSLVFVGILLLLNLACAPQQSTAPLDSPSGKFSYVFFDADIEKQGEVQVVGVVMARRNRLLYVAPELLRKRDNNAVAWDEKDRLWIYSGDTGLYYCEEGKDDKWTLFSYRKEKSPKPPVIPGVDPMFLD